MADVEDRLEVDRLTNLVQGFGWRVQRQDFESDMIRVTLVKNRTASAETEGASPG